MTPLRAVLFDKDGTLFGFQETWGVWAADLVRGLARDEIHAMRLAGAISFDLQRARFDPESPAVAGTVSEQVDLLLPHLNDWTPRDLEDHLREAAALAVPVPAADLGAVLARLAAMGLVLGVATNDAEAAALAHLDVAGIAGALPWLAGYDSGHGAKPGRGMILAFCEAHALEPTEVLMVGDSTHDLYAAAAAGCPAVGVLTGTAQRATLAPFAEAVLDDVGALPAWIAGRDARIP